MAGATDFYGLAFFDFGDELDAPLNVQREIERFVVIDRQLYGMFSVFGNGVINGWTVTFNALQLIISPGVGIINSFAVETQFSDSIANIPPDSTGYVYAIINANTVVDRTVEFVYSLTPIFQDALLLATVVSGPAAVQTLDNDVRLKIGFKQLIDDTIATHRHNGVDAPKIDLAQEVQGELPMDRVADFDASKLTGGKLPNSVLPTIDHTQLKNIGTLSHAQLDSLAQAIQKDNTVLFGEVTTINLLKMICYLLYLDQDADKKYENAIFIIPGITPDERIDWDATNANVDLETNCISGLPTFPDDISVGGSGSGDNNLGTSNLQVITVPWVEDSDWRLAASISNLTIADGVKLSVNTTDPRIVENFDTGIISQPITTYVSTLDETNVTTAIYDQPAAQGPLAGTFSNTNTRKMVHTRTFDRPQDWSSYDTLNIYVKSGTASHSPVTLIVKDDKGNELTTFLLLNADEVTTLDNADTNGFALKTFAISGFTRNSVGSIEFRTDVITNETEAFSIDTIFLTSQNFLLPSGNIKLRYNTTSPVIFNAVEFYGEFPSGTDTRVRVRTANTLEDLAAATYSSLLNSGEVFALPGTYVEIDITLVSDSTRQKTPLLESLFLSILVPAKEAGLSIQSAEAWRQGVSQNIDISDDGVISMERTNVGNFYFIEGLNVNELDPELLPAAGVTSDNLPIAPYQGFAAINASAQIPDEYNPGREFLRGMFRPRSVFRLESGNFLIADTGNDRILEMTQDGLFVRGFASHNVKYDDVLYALTANYNPRLGVLFVTFSRDLDIKFVDLRKFVLNIGGRDIQLSNAVDKVRDPTTGEVIDRPELEDFLDGTVGNFQGKVDNIVSVILSPDKQTLLKTASADTVTVRIIGNPSPATNAQIPTNAPIGLECFIGDYMYFGRGGIWRPICVRETEEDRYIIANATINYDSPNLAPTGIGSVIEFEKAIGSAFQGQKLGSTFSYSDIIFSEIMLGNVSYFTVEGDDGQVERKLLIAGLQRNLAPQTSSSSTGDTATNGQELLGSTDTTKLSKFVGKVIILDMDSQLVSFEYQSPDGLFPSDAFFDDDGNIVVAESGLVAQSGRIVTVDSVGTVIKLIEGGMYTKVWDVRKLPSGHVFVST